MPQDLHVLQCFNCETFQVDIVKKVPKWCCKMCGEKQSVKKVYGQGTGKDCRILVQSLNEQRLTKPKVSQTDDSIISAIKLEDLNSSCDGKPKISKWAKFMDDTESKELGIDAVKETESLSCNNVKNYKQEPLQQFVEKKVDVIESMFETDLEDIDKILDL